MPVFQLSREKLTRAVQNTAECFIFKRELSECSFKNEALSMQTFWAENALLRLALRKQDLVVGASFVLKNSSVLGGNECELWCLEQRRIQIRGSLGEPQPQGNVKLCSDGVLLPFHWLLYASSMGVAQLP